MIRYRPDLKKNARALRSSMTDAERMLWERLRRKQILGVQFYRQKALLDYIVDFYAPCVQLVVEVDGSQHMDQSGSDRDEERDAKLREQGLTILRFNNLEVLQQTNVVVEAIYEVVEGSLLNERKSPPSPL